MRHNALPGDHVDAPLLEASPAGLLHVGGDLGEFIGGELPRPVSLDGLFDLTVRTWVYAGRSELPGRALTDACYSPMRGKPSTLDATILQQMKRGWMKMKKEGKRKENPAKNTRKHGGCQGE